MAVAGSWSGAVIGGLMFGAGMVLGARGCSGRLPGFLAATGNLRSVIAGMVFWGAGRSKWALYGWLAPPRAHGWLSLWTTIGRSQRAFAGHGRAEPKSWVVAGRGATALLAPIPCIFRHKLTWTSLVFASGVGFAVALWLESQQ